MELSKTYNLMFLRGKEGCRSFNADKPLPQIQNSTEIQWTVLDRKQEDWYTLPTVISFFVLYAKCV
jgi:hypothetical protein